MLPIRRILYPVLDSTACRAFKPQVLRVARRFGAEVIPLHVVPTRLDLRAGEAFLAGCEWEGVAARPRVETGSVAAAIARVVTEESISLVMMPARARSFWRRWTDPSLVARVAKDCHVPVWTAWGGVPSEHGAIERIAVGVDLHGLSRRLILDAAGLAARLGAELEILHAVPRVDIDVLSASSIDDLPVALSRETAYLALERLTRMSGVDAPVRIDLGHPAAVLPALVRRHHADLLVLGAGRRTLGPNVLPIIRAAHCPVVLMPRMEAHEAAPEPAAVGLAELKT
jgi:nucleotide-binding universal stress UspA family protein